MRKPFVVTFAVIPVFLIAFFAGASPADPLEAARLNNLGVAYMNQQLFEKALKSFEEAAAKDPDLKLTTLNRGVALLNLQRPEQAKTLLEKATTDDPKDPYAWYNLGLYYKNSSEPEKAIDCFRRVTETDPDDADTRYFLGATYAQLRQFPKAIEAFDQALKINALHASANFGLARAYQQSGQADQARVHLAKFQDITQRKLGAPISLAYGEQGKYSRAEESPLAPQKVPPQIAVKFVDVTKEAGIVPHLGAQIAQPGKYDAPGACFLDYDNDGNIDLLLPDNGSQGSMSLYHNLGNGKFEDVSHKAGLDRFGPAISCTAGDYDNDGFTDIAVSLGYRVLLLHNEKNGTFKDVTAKAGINSEKPAPSDNPLAGRQEIIGLNFVDYDHDGDLDLFEVGGSRSTMPAGETREITHLEVHEIPVSRMWRNNGDGTFTDVTDKTGLVTDTFSESSLGTDYNNDRAIDLIVTGHIKGSTLFENPREGTFKVREMAFSAPSAGVAALDFDHDGWIDIAFTHNGSPSLTLWRNNHGNSFEQVKLPETNWTKAFGVVAFDYDNDGWVDLAAVGETKDGRGEVRLFRNLGPDGWQDVTADVGLDKIQLKAPRAIIAGDYDNDGAVDLLITQNHGPAVLLRNEGGNKNNWIHLALKGLADNKSAIGTKVEVFSDGIRQKFEVYGSSGYLGQNSPYLTIGLGQARQADVVRMLWPTGVLQDEVELGANKVHSLQEIDRRGSSCPTLFAWDGHEYKFVADMLGAGVVGHWIGPPQGLKPVSLGSSGGTTKAVAFPGPGSMASPAAPPPQLSFVKAYGERSGFVSRRRSSDAETRDLMNAPLGAETEIGERNIPRPVEYVKLDRDSLQMKGNPQVSKNQGSVWHPSDTRSGHPTLSFRFMEPLEESVYLDSVGLLAVDHPADVDVYPNEYFASNPPYPEFKVVFSKNARLPAGAWDEHGHDVLPDLLARRYFGDFKVLSFAGFAEPHALTFDLGEPYRGGPLWLLMHGEIEYFSANSMYAADQAGLQPVAPYVEVLQASPGVKRSGENSGTADSSHVLAAQAHPSTPKPGMPGAPVAPLRTARNDRIEGRYGAGTIKAAPLRYPSKGRGKWVRIVDDLGFPAGAARTMTADLTGKLPIGTRYIRITTNLQIYWDKILVSRTPQNQPVRLNEVPLVRADLTFHGFPLKIEDTPPGNVQYIYEKASATGPYTRPAGAYTRYGDVLSLLNKVDDKFAVFGSGDEVALDFDPANLPQLPEGWVRDYFFVANGYEKDMDFYAYHGDQVAPLPFDRMGEYPYKGKSFPDDPEHLNYVLEYNTRFMSGKEASGYAFHYPDQR